MAENSGRLTESQRAMAEALPHMVWTATPDGVVDYISREFERTTGMHGLNYANGDWLNAVHPDDREPTMAVWMAAIASGQPYQTEFRIFHAGCNDYRWHYVAAHPNRDANGRITQWFGSTVDIHDNKLAYTAIHRSEEQLRQVFEHDPHWVCVTDTSGTIQRINSAGLRLLGGDSGPPPVGAAVHQWVVPDDHTGCLHCFTTPRAVKPVAGTSGWSMLPVRSVSLIWWPHPCRIHPRGCMPFCW